MPFCAQQYLAIMPPRGDVLQPWVTGKQAHLSLFFSHTRLTYSTCRVQDTVPRMLGDGMRYQMWSMPQRFLHVGQRVKIYAEKIELAFKAIRIWGADEIFQPQHCDICAVGLSCAL